MKTLAITMAVLASMASFQTKAAEVVGATLITGTVFPTTMGLMTASGKGCDFMVCKSSAQIILDSQEYYATGRLTEYLAYEVKELKAGAGEMSNDEAVSILVDFAHRTLELY